MYGKPKTGSKYHGHLNIVKENIIYNLQHCNILHPENPFPSFSGRYIYIYMWNPSTFCFFNSDNSLKVVPPSYKLLYKPH